MAKKAKKQPTQEVPQDILDDLVRVGDLMSRTCYDVVRNKQITSQDRTNTDGWLRQWDELTSKLRDLRKGKK